MIFQLEPELAERFLTDEPKKEFALKSDHDREDLVELPEFINLPSEQGWVPGDEEVESQASIDAPEELSVGTVKHPDESDMAKADVIESPAKKEHKTTVTKKTRKSTIFIFDK